MNKTEYPYEEKTGVCRVFPRDHGGVAVKDYAAFDFRYRAKRRKKTVFTGFFTGRRFYRVLKLCPEIMLHLYFQLFYNLFIAAMSSRGR